MRNRYAGTCYRCGQIVEPGKGHFERNKGKRLSSEPGWRTQHAECAIKYRGTKIHYTANPAPEQSGK